MSSQPPSPIIPMPRITGRRANPRVRLYIPAQVQLLHGLEKCLLDDLSQAGARITLAGQVPRVGAGVFVKATGLDIFGTVIWSHGARFGVGFEEPLPLHDVVNVRHLADAWAEHEAAQRARMAYSFVNGQPLLRRQS